MAAQRRRRARQSTLVVVAGLTSAGASLAVASLVEESVRTTDLSWRGNARVGAPASVLTSPQVVSGKPEQEGGLLEDWLSQLSEGAVSEVGEDEGLWHPDAPALDSGEVLSRQLQCQSGAAYVPGVLPKERRAASVVLYYLRRATTLYRARWPSENEDGASVRTGATLMGGKALAAAVAVFAAGAALAPLLALALAHWRYFVAGAVCASVSHTAAVPMDVVKTRLQCARPGAYRSAWDAFVRIWRTEGVGKLFGGAGATLVGYAMQGFLKFGFFESLKPVLSGAPAATAATASGPGYTLAGLVAASALAEAIGSCALAPMEAVRIRMVADPAYARGVRSGLARMLLEEGTAPLVRALPAVLTKQLPYTVTKLVAFDILKRAAAIGQGPGGRPGRRLAGGGFLVTTGCALAAGVLSSLASQPGDALLSQVNSAGGAARPKPAEARAAAQGEGLPVGGELSATGVATADDAAAAAEGAPSQGLCQDPAGSALLTTLREMGFRGLWRGAAARVVHVTAIVTVQLLIYDFVKRLCGI